MPGQHLDAGRHGLSRKRLIETLAIDDDGFHRRRRVFDLVAGRRVKPDPGKLVENGGRRETKFAERFAGKDARAVDRRADALMLLEQRHAEAGLHQL